MPHTDAPAVVKWISSHHRRLAGLRGKGIVIKVGGSIQDDPEQMRTVMRDVAALTSLGSKPVIIHGGGKAISAAMNSAGIKPRFVQGQRYTDEATLAIVEQVLVRNVNRELIEYLSEEGCRAKGLHSLGTCVLEAVKAGTDAAPGKPSEDLGLVGRVVSVNVPVILGACEGGEVPVIAPVAMLAGDKSGKPGKLNINADLAAGTIAAALHPDLFILVSDTPGIRTDPAREDSYPQHLSREQTNELIAKGVIGGGMLPKVQACFEALDGGVPRVAIVDGRAPGALLGAAITGSAQPIVGTWIGS